MPAPSARERLNPLEQLGQAARELPLAQHLIAAGRARRRDHVLARVIDKADHGDVAPFLDLADGVDRVELGGSEIDEQHVGLLARDLVYHFGPAFEPGDRASAGPVIGRRTRFQATRPGYAAMATTSCPT